MSNPMHLSHNAMTLSPRSHLSLYSSRSNQSCQTGTSTPTVDCLSALMASLSDPQTGRRHRLDALLGLFLQKLSFGESAALPNTPVECAIPVPRDRTCDIGLLQCRNPDECSILRAAMLNSAIGPYILCPDHDRVGFVPTSDSQCLRKVDFRSRIRFMTGLGSARIAISS